MLTNYIKIALRSIWRNRNYVLINTFGLGIALACCITAYLLLAFNIEFDSHLDQSKIKNLYRVHTIAKGAKGEELNNLVVPYGFSELIAEEIPAIEDYFRYHFNYGYVRYGENSFGEGIAFADKAIVDHFPFELRAGSLQSFDDKSNLIINQKTADKYFKNENPVGKILTFYFDNQHKVQATVGAVVEDVPMNSSVNFNIMMRTEHFQDIYQLSNEEMGDWRDATLLIVSSQPELVDQFTELTQPYIQLRNEKKEDAKAQYFRLEHFTESINEDEVWWSQINTRISFMPVMIFLTMAGLILLIACFNLTNTTIATTSKRMKEVGVRKVVGATRRHLVGQFLTEMILIILLSVVFGLSISNILVTQFTSMWDLPFGLTDISGLNLFLALLALMFFTALMAGLYPALRSSAFKPIQLLQRKAKVASYNLVTRVLVGLQFSISVLVLMNGLIFLKNAQFQEQIDYGFNLKNVLGIFIQNKAEYDIMKARLSGLADIDAIGLTHHQLGMSSYGFPVKVDTAEYNVRHIEVGENFFEVMGLTLIQGRFLDFNRASDVNDGIVVNQQFLNHAGIQGDPLNQYVNVRFTRMRIIGVVADHVDNLFRTAEKEPFVYYASKPNEYQMVLVKADPEKLAGIKENAEVIWNDEFPDKPFQAEFQEDLTLGGLRQTNGNLKKIFLFLTVLGGLLSISGIYALASLHTERRTKEIGIRKTLGGSVSHILTLLSKEFVWILSLSAVLGLGLGYLMSNFLLDEIYAFHVEVDAMTMFISGITIFSAGVLATTSIIYRSATSNPVNSLRDE